MSPPRRMRERAWVCALVVLALGWASPCPAVGSDAPGGRRPDNWLCYYGAVFGPEIYTRFDLVVLHGHRHPPLERITAGRPVLLGYLSIGEVDIDGPGWDAAAGQPYLARENRFWTSWVVDVRDRRWQQLLFDRLIAEVLLEGFDGLFLDTFDSALALSADDQQGRFSGMDKALVEIVRRLRQTYPTIKICVNRGLPILADIAAEIDYILVEDLTSYYDEAKRAYRRVDDPIRSRLLAQVAAGRRANPGLSVLTLDYAGTDQADLVKEAISFSRAQGFVPYVSTIALDQIFFYTLESGWRRPAPR